MLLPKRHESDESYRYGFQGQEKDDEISGEGNSYTAEFWQYDSRIARRWNPDPITKPFESPYAAFKNNPNYYIDPYGLNGEVTIDKENKKVTVKADFYYNKNDEDLKRFAITEDFVTSRGTVVRSLLSQLRNEDGKIFENKTIIDDDGIEWTVEIVINFISKENDNEVENALRDNPAANQFTYKEDSIANVGAYWDTNERAVRILGSTSVGAFNRSCSRSASCCLHSWKWAIWKN
jgi:RHS repeat-associated protein